MGKTTGESPYYWKSVKTFGTTLTTNQDKFLRWCVGQYTPHTFYMNGSEDSIFFTKFDKESLPVIRNSIRERMKEKYITDEWLEKNDYERFEISDLCLDALILQYGTIENELEVSGTKEMERYYNGYVPVDPKKVEKFLEVNEGFDVDFTDLDFDEMGVDDEDVSQVDYDDEDYIDENWESRGLKTSVIFRLPKPQFYQE